MLGGSSSPATLSRQHAPDDESGMKTAALASSTPGTRSSLSRMRS